MNPFLAVLTASCLARLSYQMARSPVLPRFAESLGAAPELIGIIVAASTVTGVLFKLPAGALSDLLGRRRVMLLGAVIFAVPPFAYPFVTNAGALLAIRSNRAAPRDAVGRGLFLRFRPLFTPSWRMPAPCSRCALFMALRRRSSRRSHRLMWPDSARRRAAPD